MSEFEFRKSSYSNPERECVEVATNHPDTIAIRDSKRPDGPTLHFRPRTWLALQAALRGDAPDAP
ncbi:DUF397 domain-containing protein [Streptomyces gobiensis]|uniref:DUF397 domain-containing protein n=1 Tax=Streptomyces gobiensis TaxID=2875706 RepID=UPI001E61B3D4|nr:DUF397 domain-containing protein [Streptomyces gobiensis]UGY91314.1 DUF397 domain-containing protein [Streptomyces gobiensis]